MLTLLGTTPPPPPMTVVLVNHVAWTWLLDLMLTCGVFPDLGMKKKKKKSKKEGDDDFAAKLAALDIDKEDGEEGETVQDGDMYVVPDLLGGSLGNILTWRRDLGKPELVSGATTTPHP